MEQTLTEDSTTQTKNADIRTDMVDTAVKFLQNPRVMQRPASEKEAFLLKKGLTSAEISQAFQQAGQKRFERSERSLDQDVGVVQGAGHQPNYFASSLMTQRSKWTIIRDIGNAIVLIAGAGYGLVYLFKKFIAPLIFGRAPRQKTLAESIDEMNACITQLSANLNASMQNVLEAVNQLNKRQNEGPVLSELKNEIASVKGLLLSSRQFPAPPALSRPAIPSWQLQLGSEKVEQTVTVSSSITEHKENVSVSSPLSSSPEIISVEEVASNSQAEGGELSVKGRDSSESSESGSAEMVEVPAAVSGEDTD
nr:EOG090X0FQ8 [Eulimnadia texana]